MNETSREFLSNAGVAFVGGKYDIALELCEKAIAADPTNADAYSGAGKACMVLERLEEAEKYFQKAVELDDVNGERYFDLGNIKFGLQQYPEALTNYSTAELLGCNDKVRRKLYYQIGTLNYMSGNSNAALINFDKADSLGVIDADSKDALLKRLHIYIENQEYLKAESSALQLKMLAPSEFRSYQIVFQVLMAIGKHERAEEVLSEAEKYSDIDADIRNVADMHANKAMLCAVKAELEPDNAEAHYQSAIDIFDVFLATPDLPSDIIINTRITKAELFLKLDQYDAAIACVDDLVVSNEMVDISVPLDEMLPADKITEKIDFIKLTCYLGKEDYQMASEIVPNLKQSENEQFAYFSIYTDAFISQKLAENDSNLEEAANEKYNLAVAFFKQKAFENPSDIFATVFRIRLYAENEKYIKAEELIKMLPDELSEDLRKYVSICRDEREGGD